MTSKCVFLAVGAWCFAVLLVGAGCDTQPQPLRGPIAVVEGDVPTHGFLAVGFSRDASEPLLVKHVIAGSPAETAGVMVGDTLVALNGKALSTPAEMGQQLAETRPRDVVQVTVNRNGQSVTLDVRLLSFEEVTALQEASRSE